MLLFYAGLRSWHPCCRQRAFHLPHIHFAEVGRQSSVAVASQLPTLCCLAVGCQIGQHVNIFAKERLRFCVPISSWGLQCVMCGCDGASWYHMYGCCRNHCHLWTIQLILLVWRLTHVAACRVFCLRLLMWSSSEWVDSWETVIAIAWRAVLAYTISGLLSSCACRRVNMTWTQTKSLVCRNISCLVWVRQVPGKDAKTMESKTEMELWNENQCNDKTVFLQMQEFEHGITICFGPLRARPSQWETVIAIAWRAVLAYTISGLLSSCACRRVNMTWTQTKSLVCRNISCLVWVRQVPGKDAKTMESKTENIYNINQTIIIWCLLFAQINTDKCYINLLNLIKYHKTI